MKFSNAKRVTILFAISSTIWNCARAPEENSSQNLNQAEVTQGQFALTTSTAPQRVGIAGRLTAESVVATGNNIYGATEIVFELDNRDEQKEMDICFSVGPASESDAKTFQTTDITNSVYCSRVAKHTILEKGIWHGVTNVGCNAFDDLQCGTLHIWKVTNSETGTIYESLTNGVGLRITRIAQASEVAYPFAESSFIRDVRYESTSKLNTAPNANSMFSSATRAALHVHVDPTIAATPFGLLIDGIPQKDPETGLPAVATASKDGVLKFKIYALPPGEFSLKLAVDPSLNSNKSVFALVPYQETAAFAVHSLDALINAECDRTIGTVGGCYLLSGVSQKPVATCESSNFVDSDSYISEQHVKAQNCKFDTTKLPPRTEYQTYSIRAQSAQSFVTYEACEESIFYAACSAILEPTDKISPNVFWRKPASIIVGTPLTDKQLNARASVPGTFRYSPQLGAVLRAGFFHKLKVTFIPDEAVKYAKIEKTVYLHVIEKGDKTLPTPIKWVNVSDGNRPSYNMGSKVPKNEYSPLYELSNVLKKEFLDLRGIDISFTTPDNLNTSFTVGARNMRGGFKCQKNGAVTDLIGELNIAYYELKTLKIPNGCRKENKINIRVQGRTVTVTNGRKEVLSFTSHNLSDKGTVTVHLLPSNMEFPIVSRISR